MGGGWQRARVPLSGWTEEPRHTPLNPHVHWLMGTLFKWLWITTLNNLGTNLLRSANFFPHSKLLSWAPLLSPFY